MSGAINVREKLTRRVGSNDCRRLQTSQSLLQAWRSWHLRNNPLSCAVCPRFRGVPSVDIRPRWNRTRVVRQCCSACSVATLADAGQPTRGVAGGYDIGRGAAAALRQNVPVFQPVVHPRGTPVLHRSQRGAAQARTSALGSHRRPRTSPCGGPLSPMCERSLLPPLASAWKVASVFGRDRVRSRYTPSFENQFGKSTCSPTWFPRVGLGCRPLTNRQHPPEHKLCLV